APLDLVAELGDAVGDKGVVEFVVAIHRGGPFGLCSGGDPAPRARRRKIVDRRPLRADALPQTQRTDMRADLLDIDDVDVDDLVVREGGTPRLLERLHGRLVAGDERGIDLLDPRAAGTEPDGDTVAQAVCGENLC